MGRRFESYPGSHLKDELMLKRPDWFKRGFNVDNLTFQEFLNKFNDSLKKDEFFSVLGIKEHIITHFGVHIKDYDARISNLLGLRMKDTKSDFTFMFDLNDMYQARAYVKNNVITKATFIWYNTSDR